MALPMLVSGADCGPINPLQGLAKQFDQDRGIQTDQFVAGRAGPSREIFRTSQPSNPSLNQEAARFFFDDGSQRNRASPLPAPTAFDVSLLHKSLPVVHPQPVHRPSLPSQQPKGASWAADFLQQTRARSTDAAARGKTSAAQIEVTNRPMVMSPGPSAVGMHWTPPPTNILSRPQFVPQALGSLVPVTTNSTRLQLEEQFQSIEEAARQLDSAPAQSTDVGASRVEHTQDAVRAHRETDDLARTAALLVETVKDEQNPKFKNSQFMQLMRGLRDGDIVVDGNDMVQRSEVVDESAVGLKGKGKERAMVIDPSPSFQHTVGPIQERPPSLVQENTLASVQREEDANEAYFRRENEEYIDYWNRSASQSAQQRQAGQSFGQQNEWGALQDSWDSFEARTWGVKPISHYQFQPRNPYLNAEAHQLTMNHAMHSQQTLYESVLEMEARVQQDPTNARAWYDLGVKQQENEREPKAIIALGRAIELDPDHLPSWLALAISYTNEGDRNAADDAIQQWVRRNPRYDGVVRQFLESAEQLNGGTLDSLSQVRRHDELIHCLMTMARSGNKTGELDADVQIALAVLLNSSEDYLKAQDCFKAALSMRPDDWQLYNRVGATLANSGFSEDALQYYFRALELNPAYIRARFNLGISCMNMKRYGEAAQYILDALIMQDSDGPVHAQDDKRGVTSSTLWDSLRTSCIHLQRSDLAELCDKRDLEGFRRQFYV